MQFLRINYQGGGKVRILPEYVAYMQYVPETQGVYFYLKNGKEIKVMSCDEDDANDYIKRWREALEANQGQLSDVPLLGEDNDYGETSTESTENR